jgi:hypothetical protein
MGDKERLKALCAEIELKHDSIMSRFQDGTEKEIPLVEKWVKDPDGMGAHFALNIPDEFGVKDKIVIAVIKEGYMGKPYSLDVDRKIHVIKGKVYDPLRNQFADENTIPLEVPAGEFMNTHGISDSVIAIQFLDGEE